MPTYEYRCPAGHRFEIFQRITAEPGADCPECGAAAERIISGGAGFLFKGDGFYITDYRSEEYRTKALSEKESLDGTPPGGGDGKAATAGSGTSGGSGGSTDG